MFKIIRFSRCTPAKKYCCSSTDVNDAKSIKMPTEWTKKTDLTSKVELSKLVTKEDLQWRTSWHQRESAYYSTLRTFYSEENNTNVMKYLQMPINLWPSSIINWWKRRKVEETIALQQYIPLRNETLGNELAAAHFIVHRGGAIKFYGEDRWIKANQYHEYTLPKNYEKDKVLQAIDCTDMELHYEGLINLRNLKQVEWVSFNGCDEIDDWCMDRISYVFRNSLLYLDMRNCPLITDRGLGALHKIRTLKILFVDDILKTTSIELTCLMLQELNPSLDIRMY